MLNKLQKQKQRDLSPSKSCVQGLCPLALNFEWFSKLQVYECEEALLGK